jgi:GNAT superfamily N-acetyltransferase
VAAFSEQGSSVVPMSIETTKDEQIKAAFGGSLGEAVSECKFRSYLLEDDLNFILNSWMTSYRTEYTFLPDKVYYVGMQKLIGALTLESQVLIAHEPDDPNKILGWMVYRPPSEAGAAILVHYAYVKHRYRRFGLGKRLLHSAAPNETNVTLVASHRWRVPKPTRIRYNYYFNPCFAWKGH